MEILLTTLLALINKNNQNKSTVFKVQLNYTRVTVIQDTNYEHKYQSFTKLARFMPNESASKLVD